MSEYEEIFVTKSYKNAAGDHVWDKEGWININEADPDFEKEANHITTHKEQIILDVDKETAEEAKAAYEEVLSELKKKGYGFQAYFTGSKGYHIDLRFPGLEKLDDELRKNVKEFFIRKYECDTALKIERHMIARPGKPHWKTGKPKELIEENTGKNDIRPIIKEYEEYKEELEKHNKHAKFIFNDDEVLKTKEFPFLTFNDIAGFGIYLPKYKEVYDKNGNYLGEEQVNSPVIIGSNNELYEVGKDFEKKHNIKFNGLPNEIKYLRRWSLKSIKQFLNKEVEVISAEDLFNEIKEIYEKYMYFSSSNWYKIHALWDIGTYYFLNFKYYPLLELRGLKGTAKTKIMTISRQITFNATEEMTNPSEATLFRETHENKPSKYIDEAEKLYFYDRRSGRIESDTRAELINSGYKYTGTVPRQEKIGNKFTTVYYKTYSPTMLASINGLQGATEDRAIIHIMTKNPQGDKRGNIEPEEEDSTWQELRDKLYIFALQNWKGIKGLYEEFEDPFLKNREFWLWKPILVLARYIDPMLFDEIKEFVKTLVNVKSIDGVSEGSRDYKLLVAAYALIKENKYPILVKDIIEKYDSEEKPTNKSVAKFFDKLGFMENKDHFREGTGYNITREYYESIIFSICPQLLSSFPSLPSPHEDKKEKVCEESVKESELSCDGNEANEANEAKTKIGVENLLNFLKEFTSIKDTDAVGDFGVSYEDIEKLKEQGLIYEPKAGVLMKI